MLSRATATGKASEEVFAIPAEATALVPDNMRDIVTGLEKRVVVPKSLSNHTPEKKRLKVIPDGNRGAVIPDIEVELWDRTFLVGLKGTGARIPMYSDTSFDVTGDELAEEPFFSSESWFGENPWGAMSEQGCLEDKVVTELAGPRGINGFHICPMVRATPLPELLMERARSNYWYRRLDRPGPYYQEVRLVPSDIRLFYQSDISLGRKAPGALEAFHISGTEDLDLFIENYIRSGMAALTLLSRTIRVAEGDGFVGLDFSDVWLDKDSVIASDGTLYFADLEGLEWIPIRDDDEAKFRIRRQFDRNYYEFMYTLDRLLRERNRMTEHSVTRRELRQGLVTRLEMALADDSFLDVRQSDNSLRVRIMPLRDLVDGIDVRMLDLD